MTELLHSNTALLVCALVLAALVALWLVLANRKTRIELAPKDDTPAQRNQALIDAAPAAIKLPAEPVTVVVAEAVLATAPSPPAAAPAPSTTDDLCLIKGLGPKLKAELAVLGVTSFTQIAAWDDADIDRIDAQLGRFSGRIRRDSWVQQAKMLEAGDMAGFAAQFGNG